MKLIVCDAASACSECPCTDEPLVKYLQEVIGEYDDDETISFSQWTTTDGSTMIQQQEKIPEYIILIVSQLHRLTSHSYIAKCQTRHLQQRKEYIDSTVLALGDFAENYKFVVQDEVQSFHWNNLQRTLHPVVVYYKTNNELKHLSFCIISDDMTHDVAMVYEVQNCIINYLKHQLIDLKCVEYFSDVCAGQYKNRKNFYNLCHHKADFNIEAKWAFLLRTTVNNHVIESVVLLSV